MEKKVRKPLEERVNDYIKKCIDGAIDGAKEKVTIDSDEINTNPEYWFMIIGTDLIFDCKKPTYGTAPYFDQQFFRRLVYRLHGNLYKNFELNFYAPTLEHYAMDCSTMKYEICDDRDFNYEHAIVQVKIFDEVKVICAHDEVRPYGLRNQDELDHWIDKLREVGFDPCLGYSFAGYYLAYTKVFSEEPIQTWVRVNNGLPLYMTNEEIEKQAWVSFQKMGCTYANVCGLYKPDVCKKDGCLRFGAAACKDGFAMSRFRMILQKHFDSQYKKYCEM